MRMNSEIMYLIYEAAYQITIYCILSNPRQQMFLFCRKNLEIFWRLLCAFARICLRRAHLHSSDSID